ncbi:uncharacterized protein [Ptychodera flava]|uniref:uncharacterized protein n=1 Tax=Ptychodera flava TaxID=63121 RepID=UPI003969E8D1
MAGHTSIQAFGTAIPSNDHDDQVSIIESIADKSRNGSRISDVEKIRVFGILDSSDKRKLGKQQQILHDITERCREQDITDMSKSLTSGIQLKQNSTLKNDYRREVTMYSTNTLIRQREKSGPQFRNGSGRVKAKSGREYNKPRVERSATSVTNFRPSNIIRSPPSNYPIKTMFPKVTRVTFGGLSPTQLYNRTKWLHSRKINGPIQLEHYIQSRNAPCAPLMLPRLQDDGEHQNGNSGESTPRSTSISRGVAGKKSNHMPRRSSFGKVSENDDKGSEHVQQNGNNTPGSGS